MIQILFMPSVLRAVNGNILPECIGVIQVTGMTQLMNEDILDQVIRQEQQTAIETDMAF